MTDAPKQKTPTDGELAILRVLWHRGPSTVRDVHETLHGHGRAAYTTTLKLMQIMHDKGLVSRDESTRSHVYRAIVSEEQAQQSIVTEAMTKGFGGSAAQMMMRALSVSKASKQEIDAIRELLDRYEREQLK